MNREKIIYIIALVIVGATYVFSKASGIGTLLILLVLYGILAFIVSVVSGRGLKLIITGSGEVSKGEDARVNLIAENKGRIPLMYCLVTLSAKNVLMNNVAPLKEAFSLWSGRTYEKDFAISDQRCGRLDVEIDSVKVGDPLGIFLRTIEPTSIVIENSTHIYVMPEIGDMEISPIDLEHYDMESYRFAEGKVGTDTSETVGIRDYEPGDNIRTIHWKLSAKTGDTVVREPGYPVDNRLMILVDKSIGEYSALDEGIKNDIEKTTEFALTMSLALVKRELSHSVGWYDSVADSFEYALISVEDDVYEMAVRLISAPYTPGENVVRRYLEEDIDRNYASYSVVTLKERIEDYADEGIGMSHENIYLDRLREYGFVTVYAGDAKEE